MEKTAALDDLGVFRATFFRGLVCSLPYGTSDSGRNPTGDRVHKHAGGSGGFITRDRFLIDLWRWTPRNPHRNTRRITAAPMLQKGFEREPPGFVQGVGL